MSPIRCGVLEVERKFAGLKVYPLHIENAGSPPFRRLEHVGKCTFRDIYYDHEHKLSRVGIWVRTRNGVWQSKIRQKGDYMQSAMKEVEDTRTIAKEVCNVTGVLEASENAFGLAKLADITTNREAWKADGRFNIVLDRTDFGHTVGEVELEQPEPEIASHTTKDLQCMETEIQEFMDRYSWAFDRGPAKGKLTAFFEQKLKLKKLS